MSKSVERRLAVQREAGMSEEDGMTKIYRDSIKYWEDRARTADKRIAELEESNKWIRTEDQRPRDGQHVWVYSEWHDLSTDAFYHRPDVWEDQLGNVAQVSHWMTLPDTPESEGGADE